jgi:hypothetical protein
VIQHNQKVITKHLIYYILLRFVEKEHQLSKLIICWNKAVPKLMETEEKVLGIIHESAAYGIEIIPECGLFEVIN